MPVALAVGRHRSPLRRRLPAREPVTGVAASSIQGLDSRAVAALLKELAKTGQGARAHEFFEYIAGLGDRHDAARLCDVFTYTAAISICNNDQQVRCPLRRSACGGCFPRFVQHFRAHDVHFRACLYHRSVSHSAGVQGASLLQAGSS